MGLERESKEGDGRAMDDVGAVDAIMDNAGADVVFGFRYFVLSIAVAALLLAGMLAARQRHWFGGAVVLETWRGVGVWFAVLSAASIFLIRLLVRTRRGRPDVNEY